MKYSSRLILIVKGQCPYTTDAETKNEFEDNAMSEHEVNIDDGAMKESGNSNEFKSN